ncbi:MAG: SDR family oxidoreductase [Gammaproteobacteria bacterium]
MAPRVVLITGCARGIGLETARQFAARGDGVVATVRNPAAAGALREALAGCGAAAAIEALDVTDAGAVNRVVAGVLERHGRIDVLVNNAGTGWRGTLEELTEEDLRAAMEVNFYGPARLMKAVLPGMRAQGGGRVINVSSVAGGLGQPFNDAYCAAKHALEGLCESLYPVERAFGVHVLVVQPGAVANDFAASAGGPAARPESPFAAMRAAYDRMMSGVHVGAAPSADIAGIILRAADDPAPPPRIQAPESTARLMGLKFKDLSGERVVAMTSKWIV